jgi:enamidase
LGLIAEIGGSGLYKMEDVLPMVKLARKYSMKVSMHFGGPSIPGSAGLFAEYIIKVKPDIAVHCNGGTTAPPFEDIKRVVKGTNFIIEVIHKGNPNIMFKIVELLKEGKGLNRLIIGSDSP